MPTEPPLQALIFDAGGVFVPHDNEVLFERLAARCTAANAMDRIRAAHFDAGIGKGATPISAVHERLRDELGYQADWDGFLVDWSCHLGIDDRMLALMTALAAEHRVAVFSNTNAEHWARVDEMAQGRLEPFELYLSHEIGAVKPDLDAFRIVAERGGFEPGRCLFFDDMAENVEAARAAGFEAEQFTGQEALETLLAKRGVRWARQEQETV